MSTSSQTSISPDQIPGVHLFSGVLLGLTAPSTGLLLLISACLHLPGLHLAPHRPFVLVGMGIGWLRATAQPLEPQSPPSWDRSKAARSGVLGRFPGWIRQHLEPLPADSRELVRALVLGDRLSRHRRADYSRAGIQHLAAQSGLHIGICFASTLLLLPSGGTSRLLALAVALFYTLLAGGRPSAFRATLLLSLHELSTRRGLRPHGPGLLTLTGLIFLLVDPGCLESVGALLSFSATLGIVLLTPGIRDRLPEKIPSWIRLPLAASLGATLGSLPVTSTQFGQVPLLACLVNLVAIPLGGILVPLAFLLCITACFSPELASLVDLGFGPLVGLLDELARWAAVTLPVLEFDPLPGLVVPTAWLVLYHWGIQGFVSRSGREKTPVAGGLHVFHEPNSYPRRDRTPLRRPPPRTHRCGHRSHVGR